MSQRMTQPDHGLSSRALTSSGAGGRIGALVSVVYEKGGINAWRLRRNDLRSLPIQTSSGGVGGNRVLVAAFAVLLDTFCREVCFLQAPGVVLRCGYHGGNQWL